jgi:hypothetical protein
MSTSTRPDDAPALLHAAQVHLDRARERLDASPPASVEALDAVLASFRASLLAYLAWYGAAPEEDAPLPALAERAVRCDNVLKTAVHRAVQLVGRAPGIGAASRPTVHDREDVETGWYTARNLVRTVAGRIGPEPSTP